MTHTVGKVHLQLNESAQTLETPPTSGYGTFPGASWGSLAARYSCLPAFLTAIPEAWFPPENSFLKLGIK